MRPSSAISGDVTYDSPAARRYEQHAALHFAPVAESLVEQAEVGGTESVLEVAAGTGALTRCLAARLDPGASLLVTDRSTEMFEVAKEHSPGLGQVTYREVDYESSLPFEEGSFDLIASQFGYLHTSLAGLRECRRVLRPGGRLHLAFWADGYLELTVLSKARERIGLPPIQPVAVDEVEALLQRAGLQMTSLAGVEFPARFNDAEEYIEYRHALGLSADPTARRRDLDVLAVATELMEAEFGRGSAIAFEWKVSLVGARLPDSAA
jgi:ubiquinone/menaquinone biosynthesis C-methylase UbiE